LSHGAGPEPAQHDSRIHPEGVRPEVRSAPENDWSGYGPESYTRAMTVTVRLLLAGPR